MELLKDVADLIARYEKTREAGRKPYNIFEVLGISYKEVIMCRFLTDLLNPSGAHHRGAVYLKLFLRDILCYSDLSDEEIEQCRVYSEFPIDQERRIDIVISSKTKFIPIEVKINAREQESQCYDYYQYAVKNDKTAKVVYLTKFRTKPSGFSTEKQIGNMKYNLQSDQIICVSFQKDIKLWIEKILEDEHGEMRPVMEQFHYVVKQMTGQTDEGTQKMIKKMILENANNFRAGLEIANVMDAVKAELIVSVMKEFETQMKDLESTYSLEKEQKADWYRYESNATEAFYRKYSTYPGLNYVVKNCCFSNQNQKMWFRIEIEHNLFAGFCMFDYGDKSQNTEGNQIDEMSD